MAASGWGRNCTLRLARPNARVHSDARSYGAGWGVARCNDARRLARTLPRTCGPSALLSTPHPSPSATPSPLRGEGGARRPPAGSMTCVNAVGFDPGVAGVAGEGRGEGPRLKAQAQLQSHEALPAERSSRTGGSWSRSYRAESDTRRPAGSTVDGRSRPEAENPRGAKFKQTVRKVGQSGFLRGVGHVRITHDSHRRIRTGPASVVAGGGGRLCRGRQSGAVHRRLRRWA